MRKTIIIGSAVLMVVSIAGFITSFVLNAFVLDDYDAYGEVPIPGTRTLHLPAGDVTISFHTQIIGRTSGGGLPIPPDLEVWIKPPDGVADPELTDSVGATTTVNNDAHVQLWVAHIPETGDYTIRSEGRTSAFISPRLSFGHGSNLGFLPWLFAGVFGASLLALLASTLIPRRKRQASVPFTAAPTRFGLYAPSEEGIRIQQLKTLTSLHQSGALTDEEFEAEKRRVLGGQ